MISQSPVPPLQCRTREGGMRCDWDNAAATQGRSAEYVGGWGGQYLWKAICMLRDLQGKKRVVLIASPLQERRR